MVENEPQWFANGSTTYLYHANTDLMMTCALFGSSFAIILSMSSSVILTEENLSFAL